MRTEKEIKDLLFDWEQLKIELLKMGDSVSMEVSKHADFYINTLKWVLE